MRKILWLIASLMVLTGCYRQTSHPTGPTGVPYVPVRQAYFAVRDTTYNTGAPNAAQLARADSVARQLMQVPVRISYLQGSLPTEYAGYVGNLNSGLDYQGFYGQNEMKDDLAKSLVQEGVDNALQANGMIAITPTGTSFGGGDNANSERDAQAKAMLDAGKIDYGCYYVITQMNGSCRGVTISNTATTVTGSGGASYAVEIKIGWLIYGRRGHRYNRCDYFRSRGCYESRSDSEKLVGLAMIRYQDQLPGGVVRTGSCIGVASVGSKELASYMNDTFGSTEFWMTQPFAVAASAAVQDAYSHNHCRAPLGYKSVLVAQP